MTAIDTSVLLDVFVADPRFGSASAEMIRSCLSLGSLVACDAVWAEIRGFFASDTDACDAMGRLGVTYSPMSREAACAAGTVWKTYRARGGQRERVVGDFLIGAHATAQADRLLTRDRGFFRTYFHHLKVLDPSHPREP